MRKYVYSGTCLCGHDQYAHHGMTVVNPKTVATTGETRIPGACLKYGRNETEGEDPWGELHCKGYVDAQDPDAHQHTHWVGNTREDIERRRERGQEET